MKRADTLGGVLRIYIGGADTWQGRPLYQQIAHEARKRGLAGVTVTRGIEGFGASSRVHRATALTVRKDTPVVIELADTEEKLRAFIPVLHEAVETGLVTFNESRLIRHQEG